jgi:transcriptional regulator with XRE-family HTH domain
VPVSTTAHLGTAIRGLRKAQELTIEALAGAARIHTTYLSGIERGLANPTWKIVGKIAEALGVEVSEIACRAEELARCERERRGPKPTGAPKRPA